MQRPDRGSPVLAALGTSERTGLPVAAPKDLGERMGWPADDAATVTLEDIWARGEEDRVGLMSGEDPA